MVILRQGETLKNISVYIGQATNNIAEYTALIYALQEALLLKAQILKISTDSQLLARQMNKVYKVKHENIIGLYNQALNLLAGFKEVSIKDIPRQENQAADRLATQAIKNELRKVL
ncbi:MAG: ribonuclease HI family protein [Candidatus Omnitrophota bacterium]